MFLNQARKMSMYKNDDFESYKKSVLGIIKSGNPDEFDWFSFGNISAREGKQEEATKAFLKVIELNKDNKKAWYNLGNSYMNRGLLLEAENAYKEALKIDKNYFLALLNLNAVLSLQGKTEDSKEIEKRLKEVSDKLNNK